MFLVNLSLICFGNSAYIASPMHVGQSKPEIFQILQRAVGKTNEAETERELFATENDSQTSFNHSKLKSTHLDFQLTLLTQKDRQVLIHKLLEKVFLDWILSSLDGSQEQQKNLFGQSNFENSRKTGSLEHIWWNSDSQPSQENSFENKKRQHWSTGLAPGGK